MSDSPLLDPEVPIRAACAQGDFQLAARLTFERYGHDVLTFIVARLRREADAEEVFSMFAEDLWRGIESFEWRCSMRCWVYILARNAANRYASAPHHKPQRNLPLSQFASALAARDTGHPRTPPHHDTALKRRVRALRERLASADQMLLILHVDRGLPWRELALVMHEGAEPLEGEPLEREAARLRKRFERVKSELRRMAVEEGLL